MNLSLDFCGNQPLSFFILFVGVLIAFLVGGTIKFDLFGQTIEMDFTPLREHMRKFGGAPEPGAAATTLRAMDSERSDMSARDGVVEGWGSLKQMVYDLALVQRIPLTPATRTPEAVHRLLKASVIGPELAEAIRLFYAEGKNIADQPNAKVDPKSAAYYQECIYRLMDWIMCHAFLPVEKEAPAPPPAPRKTQVGGVFPKPERGMASAVLVGRSGALSGRSFPIDRGLVKIGSDPGNDISIENDAYVSGHHAEIRYERGGLWLSDRHSKNGTLLNGQRLTQTAVPLILS